MLAEIKLGQSTKYGAKRLKTDPIIPKTLESPKHVDITSSRSEVQSSAVHATTRNKVNKVSNFRLISFQHGIL